MFFRLGAAKQTKKGTVWIIGNSHQFIAYQVIPPLFISISYASCILDIHGMIPGNEHTFIVRSEHDQSSVSRISIQNYWGVINQIRFLLNTPMVYSQIYALR